MKKWEVANSGGKVITAGVGHPEVICVLETVPLKITDEVQQRAKLIAAAPDLLEACTWLRDSMAKDSSIWVAIRETEGSRDWIDKMEAAISKATN